MGSTYSHLSLEERRKIVETPGRPSKMEAYYERKKDEQAAEATAASEASRVSPKLFIRLNSCNNLSCASRGTLC